MDVQCELCPKACVIAPGESGECRVRINDEGTLRAVTYGFPSAVHVDPIEKKPLNHFLPGSQVLSLATVGCNLHCRNCQNWELSQTNPEEAEAASLPPAEAVRLARRFGCPSIATTYSEPIIYYEYTLDICRAAREAGLRNVLVTAGYAEEAPWRELSGVVDAANIDLKSIRDDFYREVCDATLAPVLRSLALARSLGVWVEVTNLLIPGLNDRDEEIGELSRWVRSNLGPETPLHFSRFWPQYRLQNLPPTAPETLLGARKIARAEGLHHVYLGNVLVEGGSDTHCASCGALLVRRVRYRITENRIPEGRCPDCRAEVAGRWK